jgi:hypothetical protein
VRLGAGVPEAPTAVIGRGAAAPIMGAWCPSGGGHSGASQRQQWLGQRERGIGIPRFYLFLDILLFSYPKCHVSLSNGSHWSETASILSQCRISVFCKQLNKMWRFFVLKM